MMCCEEAGQVWLGRVLDHFSRAVWINPTQEKNWGYTHSIGLIKQIFADRMFPLTLSGLDAATRELSR